MPPSRSPIYKRCPTSIQSQSPSNVWPSSITKNPRKNTSWTTRNSNIFRYAHGSAFFLHRVSVCGVLAREDWKKKNLAKNIWPKIDILLLLKQSQRFVFYQEATCSPSSSTSRITPPPTARPVMPTWRPPTCVKAVRACSPSQSHIYTLFHYLPCLWKGSWM